MKLDALPDDAWMNHLELAVAVGLDPDPLRSRLNRWRRKNPGSDGWQEVMEQKARQPKYIYRVGTVRPVLREALASSPATK